MAQTAKGEAGKTRGGEVIPSLKISYENYIIIRYRLQYNHPKGGKNNAFF